MNLAVLEQVKQEGGIRDRTANLDHIVVAFLVAGALMLLASIIS